MDDTILIFVLVGALAQLIDGSLDMGYKPSTSMFFLTLGVAPVVASSSVHLAGVTTSAASGVSHYRFGNFDRRLFQRLVIPGILGGITGAALLNFIPGDVIKPLIAIYLLPLGLAEGINPV
ncbi:MAG: sulfite exporter TauE/SafE family protein [Chloroflexota bacterium]